MRAPRVLPTERSTAPRLSLVDNIQVDAAAPIIEAALDQNAKVCDLLSLPPVPRRNTPSNYRKRLHLEGKGLNGDVEVRRYDGPCHLAAVAKAEEIVAERGGWIHITGPYTLAIRNYPPEN